MPALHIPTYRGPAFLGAILALAGSALVYWSLVGWGIVSGNTPEARKSSIIAQIKGTTVKPSSGRTSGGGTW